MLLKTLSCFYPLSALKFHHDSESFSGLMWAKFIEKVMNMNEQETEIFNFFSSTRRVWTLDK